MERRVFKVTAPNVAPLLGPIDLEGVAKAAYLLGAESEGSEVYRRAHQEFLNLGQVQDAARCAFWVGFMSLINGRTGCSACCESHRLANQVLRFQVLSKAEDIARVVFDVEISAIVRRVLDRASDLNAT